MIRFDNFGFVLSIVSCKESVFPKRNGVSCPAWLKLDCDWPTFFSPGVLTFSGVRIRLSWPTGLVVYPEMKPVPFSDLSCSVLLKFDT